MLLDTKPASWKNGDRRNSLEPNFQLVETYTVACFCCPGVVFCPFLVRVASHSQRHVAGDEAGDIATRMSATSPGPYHTKQSSITGRTQREDEETAAGISSRQRPLSAPPKAYPFSRDLGLLRESNPPGVAGYREETAGRIGRGNANDLSPREAGRLRGGGESKERAVGGYGGYATAGSVATRTAQERLSLSSIFGAASERRVSEEKRPSIRDSLLLDGNDGKPNSSGAVKPALQEKSEREGCGGQAKSATTAAAAAALSSQGFGLHQWKEYAVLR